DAVKAAYGATKLVRDLINTPASDLGPAELAVAIKELAGASGAQFREVVGVDLIREDFPAVYAVGRGAEDARAPRLVDFTWGRDDAPRVTLVGKGVTFDSGGLDIKPASAMKLMKKDMGGAAHALGVASMVMAANLDVRLRVIVAAVENSVSGSAMRPLDVVATRKGVSVEIGHTDAEGRVILSDALALASEDQPDVIIDFATLTGAARVALGTDLPALFCNDDALAAALLAAGARTADPLWRMPLWKGYKPQIKSSVADIKNDTDSPYGGAITAALFLEEFVTPGTAWAHIDLMAWNTASQPGRPEGGEAMTLRAVFAMLAERFA
ncbi:MAG: leucyl aminopeptidase family protein, partial [Alphaproteobacteria bacterium]|nr:leucyl aminopeptidase family protein [Alphaproteobacteria bacterium]